MLKFLAESGDIKSSLVDKIDNFLQTFAQGTKKFQNILLAIFERFCDILSKWKI
jgi:hypothetical protein